MGAAAPGLEKSNHQHGRHPEGHQSCADIWSVAFETVIRLAPKRSVDFSLGRCRNLSSLAHSYAARNLYAIFAPVLGLCYPALVQGNQVVATLDTYKPGFNAGGGLEFHLGDAGLK